MTLYEFMEDFDNAELPEDEWREQMEDAVMSYYDKYDPNFQPHVDVTIQNYQSWKREKLRLEE